MKTEIVPVSAETATANLPAMSRPPVKYLPPQAMTVVAQHLAASAVVITSRSAADECDILAALMSNMFIQDGRPIAYVEISELKGLAFRALSNEGVPTELVAIFDLDQAKMDLVSFVTRHSDKQIIINVCNQFMLDFIGEFPAVLNKLFISPAQIFYIESSREELGQFEAKYNQQFSYGHFTTFRSEVRRSGRLAHGSLDPADKIFVIPLLPDFAIRAFESGQTLTEIWGKAAVHEKAILFERLRIFTDQLWKVIK